MEDRIGEILIALYEASYSARLKRLEREEREKQAREEERKREQIRKNYDMEVEKTQALVNKAKDYEIACRIRRYIDAVRNNPDAANNNPDWIDWATKKQIGLPHPLLMKIPHWEYGITDCRLREKKAEHLWSMSFR